MALSFDRIRVQNQLVTEGKAGPFYKVAYDATTHAASADTSASVAPSTAVANEISCRFQDALLARRSQVTERQDWFFQLVLEFDQEVVLDGFVERVRTALPRLARDSANGLDYQVTLKLRNADIKHPIQQEASNGTKVVFLFEAIQSPN